MVKTFDEFVSQFIKISPHKFYLWHILHTERSEVFVKTTRIIIKILGTQILLYEHLCVNLVTKIFNK